jgi:hypothetical protein
VLKPQLHLHPEAQVLLSTTLGGLRLRQYQASGYNTQPWKYASLLFAPQSHEEVE